MEYSEQVVAVLAEGVVKVVKQLLAEYNTQMNQKLKNLKISGENIKALSIDGSHLATGSVGGNKIGQGTVSGDSIADDAITGDKIADGTIGNANLSNGAVSADKIAMGTITGDKIAPQTIESANIKDASIDVAKINNLTAEVMAAVVANIASANIDWAKIESLQAATVEASKATIKDAKITWAQIDEADVEVAKIADAQIGYANIDFSKVKDSVVGTQIITKGVAGEFYINKLQVTDANIASLTAGKLILQNAEGVLHELYIDENGQPATKIVEVGTNNIGAGVVTGDKIAAGAVSTEQINAAAIFGDEAVVINMTAGLGKFGDLFAGEAVIESLKAHVINSDYLRTTIQDSVQVGARNLVKKSDEQYSNSDYIVATYDFGNSPPAEGELVSIRIKGSLGQGKTCFSIANTSNDVVICNLEALGDGTYGRRSIVWNTKYYDASGNELAVDNSQLIVRALEASTTGVSSTIDWIMVERGTQMSDWSLAPEDVLEAAGQLETQIDSITQQIMTPDQVATTVRKEISNSKELSQLQTTVQQNASDFEVRITRAESNIDSVTDTANATKTNLDTWYHFGENALTIGKSNSAHKTRQSNEKYEFLYQESPVATLSGDIFDAPKMSVSDEFRFGGLVAVIDKMTGDIDWIWRGTAATAVSSFNM